MKLKAGEILIVLGVIIVPLSLSAIFAVAAITTKYTDRGDDFTLAFLWAMAAVALGLIASGAFLLWGNPRSN
jgi:hypothetical protein